uniref:Secreted protein n=1 Tax=Onchocerca volvulus TaxID=6282 RepID=A0A8R1U094_ONCVO
MVMATMMTMMMMTMMMMMLSGVTVITAFMSFENIKTCKSFNPLFYAEVDLRLLDLIKSILIMRRSEMCFERQKTFN